MNNHKNNEILKQINNKLGFDVREYNKMDEAENPEDIHEKDNIPNPFDKLTMEELLFIRANRELLIKS